jgi:Fe-S cluster assembly ATP-binding protein
MSTHFEIKDLYARCEAKEILKGLNLTIQAGETHALMGPNGSGKSTLSNVIMGHPAYEVTAGEILFKGQNVVELDPEERARLGLFLAFQYPVAIPGVSVAKFLKSALDARAGDQKVSTSAYLKELKENLAYLEMDPVFLNRFLNEGFSGGEKKRMEILQMLMLKPAMAIMDETDSGLDIDALRIVSKGVNKLVNPGFGLLVITHYERILRYIKPSHMHVLIDGRIAYERWPRPGQGTRDQGLRLGARAIRQRSPRLIFP